jgi:hypothetical protein
MKELAIEFYHEHDAEEILKHININERQLLEIVELYAEYNEQTLSKAFDDMIEEGFAYDLDDYVAVREAFTNWTGSLCKANEIHVLQYNNYAYVGVHQ